MRLQAIIVADRWGATSLGALEGTFAALLTAVTSFAPAAGPTVASWLGSFTSMTYTTAATAGLAGLIAGGMPLTKGSVFDDGRPDESIVLGVGWNFPST